VHQLVLGVLDGPLRKKTLFRRTYFEFVAVASVAAYVYEQAAVIGMNTSAHGHQMVALVLEEPSDAAYERFRAQTVEHEGEEGRAGHLLRWYSEHGSELDAEAVARLLPVPPMMHLLHSEWPEVYAPGAQGLTGTLYKQRLRQRWTPEEALALWGQTTAAGLGLGLFFPERTEEMLQVHFDVDPKQWQQAREDGVDLPTQPPSDTFDSYVARTFHIVKPLIEDYYPDLLDMFQSGQHGG
jgi:hypothetical protein